MSNAICLYLFNLIRIAVIIIMSSDSLRQLVEYLFHSIFVILLFQSFKFYLVSITLLKSLSVYCQLIP